MAMIFLGNMCNNDCIMCSVEDTPGLSFEADKKDVLKEIEKNANRNDILEFSGGEPTKHPDIKEFFHKAQSEGYDLLKLSSNGRKFSSKSFTKELVDSGLERVDLAVHGPEETHDKIVGVDGAFQETIQGVKNLQSFGVQIATASVLIQQNVDALPTLYEILEELGVRRVGLLELVPEGNSSGPRFRRFALSYPAKKKFLYNIKEQVADFDIFEVVNFSRCVLPTEIPEDWSHLSKYQKKYMDYDYKLTGGESSQEGAAAEENYTKFCDYCPQKAKCCGFTKDGLELFGPESVREMLEIDHPMGILQNFKS